MFNYLVRRALTSLLTLWLITFIVFALIRNMPGDPIKLMVMTQSESGSSNDSAVTNENIENMRKAFGLDKPWYTAYWSWLFDLMKGDLGRSIVDRKLVTERIGERLGPTLNLSIISITLIYILAIPIGLFVTAKNGRWQEQVLSNVFYVLYSFPSYVMALYLILFLSVRYDILPLGGMTSRTGYDDMSLVGQAWDRFKHLVFPVTCFTYGGLAYYTRFIRMNMLEVIRQDYVRTARAKGVNEAVVFYRHAFRNALIPLVTLIGLALPGLLGGSVILEQIFSWPGMGKLFLEAITQRDYPVIMGLTLTFSVLVQMGSLLADILYAVVDPRISYS